MLASIVYYLIPAFILGGLVLLFGVIALLGRFRGGKYLKPVLMALQKLPFMERWMQKASRAALEKQNPELASAISKIERSGSLNDPLQAQRALSKLTSAERKAYLDAAGDQGPGPQNRVERRRLERARKRAR
jgi:hypothetical protein